MTWSQVLEDFAPDGSVRDIYVRQVSTEDWEVAYRWLLDKYRHEFTRDGIRIDPPSSVESIWRDRAVAFSHLTLRLDGLQVNCYFFESNDLELDFRPEQVDNEERFDAVTELMEGLGQLLLNKRVILTYQNGKDNAAFLEFRPQEGGLSYRKPKWR